MKRYIFKTIMSIVFIMGILTSCEDLKFGDAFLEKPMSDDVDIDVVFSEKKYADQALNQFYKSLPDFLGSWSAGPRIEAITLDLCSDIGYSMTSWERGTISASSKSWPYNLWHEGVVGSPFYGIRKAYIYIENVDRVPDMSTEEKIIRKAEAKVVIALHYVQMIRFLGGIPWIDHAYEANETFKLPRMTLEESVNKVCDLLDEAARDLPWHNPTDEELGHMTAAGAKALKFRLLMFVASPIFNANEPYYAGEAANKRLTWYGDYQESRWQRALNAGLEFLRMNVDDGNNYQIEDTDNPREDYVNGYFTRGNREVILPTFRWAIYKKGHKAYKQFDQGKGCPRGNYADMFQWKDGSPFDWNNPEHRKYPFFDAEGNPTRDVRLYENLLVNGDKWQKGRPAEVYEGGQQGYGTNSKVGQRTKYGYGFRKFIRNCDDEIINKPYSCPWIRMPEIYLNMAEVMNQLNMATQKDEFGRDAYDYLNLVHERAGLPPVTAETVTAGTPLLEYLLDERAREFGQEDVRYYDMVRYKKGKEWATRPLEELKTRKNGNEFTYEVIIHNDSKYMWRDYWYLLPFPTNEINKKFGLIQNPGW